MNKKEATRNKLEDNFMVQWLYADDTQDSTHYMNREKMINRFKQTFPFVKNDDFVESRVTIGIVSVKIVQL